MRPGTRVVSHDFDMGDWHWDQRSRIGNATVYLWTLPARVAGNWTLSTDGRRVPLAIEQRYQTFTGRAGAARIEQGRLNGDRIRFLANFGAGRRTFEGRVSGDTIVPVAPGAARRKGISGRAGRRC